MGVCSTALVELKVMELRKEEGEKKTFWLISRRFR
jgi:hypothetical protein